jgi:peptidoglycan/LPS O-acetylase OafA/YrhL
MPTPPSSVTGVTRWILDRWFQGGWVGVDLFFVLSGFLVGGLLFAEIRATGRMRIARFYGRRGFKIYPAFYFFLGVSALAVRAATVSPPSTRAWLAEIFFVQSYFVALWGHTWSLAVEEHFYLLLPVLLRGLGIGASGSRADTNRIISSAAVAAVGCLALRCVATVTHPYFDLYIHLFPSHLRFDALMAGVVLAYFWHFHRERVLSMYPWRRAMFCAGVVVLMLPFALPLTNAFMHSVGLTTNYLAGTAILIAVLLSNSTSRFMRALGWFGPSTYSIYLFHELILAIVPTEYGYGVIFLAYVGFAFAAGWAVSTLIEWPALRLRDRVLPRSA